MLNLKKKLTTFLLAFSIMTSAISLNVFAVSNASSGSASGLTFDGQSYTVAMTNCNMSVDAGAIAITNFGSGSGDIKFGAYCGSTYSYYKTFSGTKKYTFTANSVSGFWGVDGKNTSLLKTRTNVSVSWDLV